MGWKVTLLVSTGSEWPGPYAHYLDRLASGVWRWKSRGRRGTPPYQGGYECSGEDNHHGGHVMSNEKLMGEWNRYFLGEPLRIGNRRVLLVDDFFVEDRWNVTREVNVPLKHPCNPVLVQDKPWDNHAYAPSVLFDEEAGVFRMWYGAFDSTAFVRQYRVGGWDPKRHGYPYYVCYAESADGVNWEKPALGLDYREWKNTNVVMVGEQKCQGHRVIENHPSSGQPGRFVMNYRDNVKGTSMGLCLAYSDDGIHWRPDPGNPVYSGVRDTMHNVLYDDERERWLLYTRPMSYAGQHKMTEADMAYGMKSRGAVAVGETPQSFHYPRCILWPEEDEPAKIDAFLVVKCGSHFIGFKTMMTAESLNDVYLVSSRDGIRWKRLPGAEPYIARGREGDFDCGQAGAPKNIVEVGDWYYLYYWGTPRGQKTWENISGIGLAMIHRDRFVAQVAGESGGYLLTREFVVEGDELRVNIATYGQVRNARFAAELIRVPREGPPTPIEGYTFEVCDAKADNLLDGVITWQGKDVSALRGTAVQVRFYLRNVGLYAVQCADRDG